MITILNKPMPCVTPLGEGYIWYIKDNGMYENDELTVILNRDGAVKHFTTEQVNIYFNSTYEIGRQDVDRILTGYKKQEGPF